MSEKSQRCSECDSEQFITGPFNCYILEFENNEFVTTCEEYVDEQIYCRKCRAKIDIDLSIKNKKVTLKQ